jgi:hypothetical protein
MYELNFIAFGIENYATIGEFKNRTMEIQIYDMEAKYKALEGNYKSYNDAEVKMELLKEPPYWNFLSNSVSWDNVKIDNYTYMIYIHHGEMNPIDIIGKYRFIKTTIYKKENNDHESTLMPH